VTKKLKFLKNKNYILILNVKINIYQKNLIFTKNQLSKKNMHCKTKTKTTSLLVKLIFTMILTFSIFNLQSQEIIWGNSIGLFGGVNFNMHSPDMRPSFVFLPSNVLIPVNLNKTNNSVTGFAGLEGNFQISKLFVFTGRLGYDFVGVDYNLVDRNTTYDLKTSLHYLDFMPMLKLVNLIPNFESLYFTTGFNIGVPIIKKYDITQQIGTGTNVRNSADNIPESQMRMSIPIGIGYIWKYNWELAIIPEISYHIGLNDVSSDETWSTWNFNQLKAGISITYKLQSKKKDKTTTIESIPTRINVGMDNVYYKDKNGIAKKVDNIKLEESEYGEYFPLIPYIFYDVNETEIPPEYKHKTTTKTEAGPVEEELLPNNAISLAYRLLDIVGKRLVENPNANLTITGTIDERFETNRTVAEARAKGVKDYLNNNYNIADSRLKVEHRGLPAKPSAQSVRDGIIENRRVELSSNNLNIFDPVFVKGEKIRFATPDHIFFVPMSEANKPIIGWDLEIHQADRIIKQLVGEQIEEEIKWDIMINDLYPSELPIEYKYSVYTSDNVENYIGYIKLDYVSISKSKSIEQPDYTITKYSLVLFDFDSPLLTEHNKQVIDKFLIPNVRFGSNIDIYGYSDKIGNDEYNRRLSLQRANAVRDYIQTKNRNVKIRTNGLGSDTEIFDNNLPVGRQLSRTVQILVITPKE